MSIGSDFTGAVGTAGGMLKGAADTELQNKQLDQDKITSGLNFIKDASGKAIDFMSQIQSDKAGTLRTEMMQEGLNARKMADITAKQQAEATKINADKAKQDYENFVTMTPELAQGLYSSTGGRLDFRKQIGSRLMTKVLIPMIQISGRAEAKETPSGDSKNKTSPKELNALKAFMKQYEDIQKQYSGMDLQLKQSMATRNPTIKGQVDEKLKFLQDNKAKYEEARQKVGQMGGVEPSAPADRNTAAPPPTSASDEDALIDRAFSGQ